MAERVIFHVDANSAFLSWSAAYRVLVLHEETDLREVPSVVAGDKESRHSIILAKSTPAKKYGIQTGEPLFQAMEKDCQAGTMAQLWEYHQSQNVYGYIRLDYYIPKNGESINSYDMVRSMEITVYEDCKNTVSYLQSLQ